MYICTAVKLDVMLVGMSSGIPLMLLVGCIQDHGRWHITQSGLWATQPGVFN
jgi:hypothetical protein